MEINKELESIILNNLPNDLTKLEKAILIYIMLARILTYDDLFYIMNGQGNIAKYHEDITNLKKINVINNKIVCYEFNNIYAYFLDLLKARYRIQDYSKNKYTKGHANLIFEIDGFKVKADSVSSILMGDLTNVKLNYPLKGLVPLNKEDEFREILDKLYKVKKEIINLDNLNNYQKLKHIINKVKERNLAIIDSISYLLLLRDNLFSYDEKASNIRASLVRDNELLKVIVVISLNIYDFENEEDETDYYIFDNSELKEISIEELRSNFYNLKYEYFENDLPRIPGVNNKRYYK